MARVPGKVAIVGVGYVGSTFAYSLLVSGVPEELVLVDARREMAEGHAMDLNHGLSFVRPIRVYAGDYGDLAGAEVVVIAAGAAQKPGESRLDLVQRNAALFRDLVPEVVEHNNEAVLLVVTNPVDVLTYLALKHSSLPSHQVIGSGTALDSARFRFLLGQYLGVDPRSVHAYILGEHGDTEVPIWSAAHIAGVALPDFCAMVGRQYDPAAMQGIFEQVRNAAYQLIERKGVSNFAIGLALTSIVQAILHDEQRALPVSTLVEDYYGISDVCFSLPCIVGSKGIVHCLHPHLSPEEVAGLRQSAELIKGMIRRVGGG